jgi:hypothetical protein
MVRKLPKDPTRWIEAPEVKDIADRLIPKYHAHLRSWAEEIRYVFRNEAQVSKGRTVWGKAHKIAGLPCYLATNAPGDLNAFDDVPPPPADMFVMEIAADIWAKLTPKQQEALVDHELMHFTIEMDDNAGLVRGIRGHDVEEFSAIAERHGAWKPDLAEFAEALQLSLNVDAMPGGVRFPSGRDEE